MLHKNIPNWQELLIGDVDEEECEIVRRHERGGRPLANNCLVARVEKLTNRVLIRKKPGPKIK